MAATNHESIAAALAAAQAEFPPIPKTRVGKIKGKTKDGKLYDYEYHYAALEDIVIAARPVLSKHGLAFVQPLVSNGEKVGTRTDLYHESGQTITGEPFLLPAGPTAQSAGSAVTYARRYSLSAALGIATEDDDDGKGATDATKSAGSRDRNTASSSSADAKDGAGNGAATAKSGGAASGGNLIAAAAVAGLEKIGTTEQIEQAMQTALGEDAPPTAAGLLCSQYNDVAKELKVLVDA